MSQLRLNITLLDKNEAPKGFYAIPKDFVETPNVCNSCDAKNLCQVNKDDWCLHNRCMSYEITAFKDGKTYARKDGVSVVFKKLEEQCN